MKKAIYQLNLDCGYGALHGIFVAEKSKIEKIINTEMEIYFGEVLGKHSEVYGPIGKNEIEMLTDDLIAIDLFEKYKLGTGYNLFDYLSEGQLKELE